ncbi:MAG: hypothetical protein E6I93_00295 [Chloroflexi bacterium]|nr:MAG: hypothetical protein E6I93_00295 [Chloroflexota bacterium]
MKGLARARSVQAQEFTGVGSSDIDEVELRRESCRYSYQRADGAASEGELGGNLERLSVK